MTNNIINSSFCDDLKLKDMSISIRGSCIGRKVKIGRSVQIINSVIMNNVTIKDGVTINQAIVSCGCRIGRG